MSKSLVEIATTQAKIETALIESGGEITPDIEAMITEIDLKLPEKVDSYDGLIQRMEMLTAYYRGRAADFTKLARGADAFIDKLKNNLKFAATSMGVKELIGVDQKFVLVPGEKVEIDELAKLPASFIVTEVTHKPDAKAILRELKEGHDVPGARLVETMSVRRYANTNRGRK